jgi:predicted transposase YdaD
MPSQEIEEKTETEYLKNLFLALKFARNERFVLKDWPNVLTFGKPFYRSDREGILLQTLTLYVTNFYKMTEAQVKELSKQLPQAERDWIDAIPEIFGRKWKEEGLREGREEGREKGREETAHAITIKTIQKFPDWSDAAIAEFVGVAHKYVQQVRCELAEKKQG